MRSNHLWVRAQDLILVMEVSRISRLFPKTEVSGPMTELKIFR